MTTPPDPRPFYRSHIFCCTNTRAGCLDRCELGPTMVIYPEGVWYGYRDTADIDEILETHVKGGGRVSRLMLQPEQKPPGK